MSEIEDFKPQKNSRYFGEYRCPTCNRLWMSANSWLECGQMCKKCNVMVMAYKLIPLRKSYGINKIDEFKRHEESLCGKCKQLGRRCGGRSYNRW